MIGCVDLMSDPTTDHSVRLDLPTSEYVQPACLHFAGFVLIVRSQSVAKEKIQ